MIWVDDEPVRRRRPPAALVVPLARPAMPAARRTSVRWTSVRGELLRAVRRLSGSAAVGAR